MDDNTFKRTLSFDRASINEEARTAAVSFSSQETVRDVFWGPPRALLHEKKAVNLSVMRAMGAALLNHDPSKIVGRAAELVIDEEERKGRAVIHFDDDEDGNRAFAKVKSGSLRGVSVRFSVEKSQILDERSEWKSPGGQTFRGGDSGLEVATRWTVREISLTPIPADVSVGVGRGANPKEETPMFSDNVKERMKARGLEESGFTSEAAAVAVLDQLDTQDAARAVTEAARVAGIEVATGSTTVVSNGVWSNQDSDANRDDWRKEASAKLTAFEDLAKRCGKPEKAGEWFKADATIEDAQREAFGILSAKIPAPAGPPLERGHEPLEKCLAQIETVLSRRLGIEPDQVPEDLKRDAPHFLSVAGAARMYLRAANVKGTDFLMDEMVLDQALRSRIETGLYDGYKRAAAVHTTGDFTSVLGNIARKRLLKGAEEANTTYQLVASMKQLKDFHTHTFVQAGEIENLELTPDASPFPSSTMSDKQEGMALFTRSRKIGWGRQALINDDLGALGDMAGRLGNASARTRNQVFWAHIVQASGVGPTMTEGAKTLFSATHASGSNYFIDATANLKTSSLNKGRELLRKQKGLTASTLTGRVTPVDPGFLNITASQLVIPAALEATADELVHGTYFPTTAVTAQTNYVRNLTIVVEPQLDATSLVAWYLFASPSTIDTVAFATLAGSSGPMFRSWQEDDGLGLWFAAIDDFGVQALEHRGVFRSKGEA